MDSHLADALAQASAESSWSRSLGNCFVVCRTPDGRVALWQSRQEDNPGRPIVFGTLADWEAFEAEVKAGKLSYAQLPVAVET